MNTRIMIKIQVCQWKNIKTIFGHSMGHTGYGKLKYWNTTYDLYIIHVPIKEPCSLDMICIYWSKHITQVHTHAQKLTTCMLISNSNSFFLHLVKFQPVLFLWVHYLQFFFVMFFQPVKLSCYQPPFPTPKLVLIK